MLIERDIELPDGRTLHLYDTGTSGDADELAVFWHHGTPNTGAPPAPLYAAARRLGVRWVSIDRPGYGGSTPLHGRDVAAVAGDVGAAVDALGIDTFAVYGHSGGGPHAIACGALLGDRVLGVVSVAGLAPYDPDLGWLAGMAPGPAAGLRAAVEGRAAKERFEADAGFDPTSFTTADYLTLKGPWGWFDEVVGPAVAAGPGGLIADDLAYVAPWGFDPADVRAPMLLVHGEDDRMVPCAHSVWLAERCPTAELWTEPDDGHLSVLRRAEDALGWLVDRARADVRAG